MRKLRQVPEGGALVEVTCRTIQCRLLLLPVPELCTIIVGILARAQRLCPVDICGLVFLSNHFHLLLRVPDAERLSGFMNYVNSNLAREAGRLHRWRAKFWSRRYQAIVVSEEEGAQIGRLKYLLSHGCKEGLVARPEDWPGVHGIHALLTGEPLLGRWFDRTKEYTARSRSERVHPRQFVIPETLTLAPLPCWRHLPLEEIRARVEGLLREIEAEAAVARKGKPPFGARAILKQHPHSVPVEPKRSPAPSFHAASRVVRDELQRAYARFVAAFREASARLRAGDRTAEFPLGAFPPAMPFVRAADTRSESAGT